MSKKELDRLINSLEVIKNRLSTISNIAIEKHIAPEKVIVPDDVVDADGLGPCDPGACLVDVIDAIQTICD